MPQAALQLMDDLFPEYPRKQGRPKKSKGRKKGKNKEPFVILKWSRLDEKMRHEFLTERALMKYFLEFDDEGLAVMFFDNHTFDGQGNKITIPYLQALTPAANEDLKRLMELKNEMIKKSLTFHQEINAYTGEAERFIVAKHAKARRRK